MSTQKEPAVLTAEMIRDTAFKLPEGYLKFLRDLTMIGANTSTAKELEAAFKPAIDLLKKSADAVDALIRLYNAYKGFQNGQHQRAFGELLVGAGSLW